MMHVFMVEKRSTKMLAHHKTVLKEHASGLGSVRVSVQTL